MKTHLKVIEKRSLEIALFLKRNKTTFFALYIAFLFAESFFKKANSDFILFSSLLAYGVFVKILKTKSDVTFLLCLILLIGMSINLLFVDRVLPMEKMAVWIILLFGVGLVQQWQE